MSDNDDDDDDEDDDDDDDDDTDNRGQLVTRPVLTNDRIRNGDACPDCTSHTIAIAHYCHTIAGCTNHTIAVGGQLLHLLHYAVSFYTIAPTPKHTHTHMLLHSLALHFAIAPAAPALYCICAPSLFNIRQ